jgi:acyl carrier protein
MLNERQTQIRDAIARELRVPPHCLKDSHTLEEMGLDSLASAEIVLAIEQMLKAPLDTSLIAASITRDTRLAELIAAIDAAVES